MKSDGTEKFATAGSVNGCASCGRRILSGLDCAYASHGFVFDRWYPTPIEAAGEQPVVDIKSPIGAPLLIFPLGYLQKFFPQRDTSARQWGFEI